MHARGRRRDHRRAALALAHEYQTALVRPEQCAGGLRLVISWIAQVRWPQVEKVDSLR
jgi:hypothetical protein